MSGTCYRCGTGLGFFDVGEPICKPCKTRRDQAVQAWVAALDQAVGDRVLMFHEERQLRAYQQQLGLWDQEIAAPLRQLHRVKTFNQLYLGMLPIVQSPIALHRGEVAHLCAPSTLLETRTHREYHAGSRGVSVRLMKGVSFRVGASRGYSVPVTELVPLAQGYLVLTNRRLVFTGQRNVLVPYSQLASFEAYSDAVQIGRDGRARDQYFQVQDGEYTAAVLAAASQAEEVRPVYGQSAYVYTAGDPDSTIAFFPDDNSLMHAEQMLEHGDDYGLRALLMTIPKLVPGTVVDIGNPAGLHVEARPQAGDWAGRWGYVLFSETHIAPPA